MPPKPCRPCMCVLLGAHQHVGLGHRSQRGPDGQPFPMSVPFTLGLQHPKEELPRSLLPFPLTSGPTLWQKQQCTDLSPGLRWPWVPALLPWSCCCAMTQCGLACLVLSADPPPSHPTPQHTARQLPS